MSSKRTSASTLKTGADKASPIYKTTVSISAKSNSPFEDEAKSEPSVVLNVIKEEIITTQVSVSRDKKKGVLRYSISKRAECKLDGQVGSSPTVCDRIREDSVARDYIPEVSPHKRCDKCTSTEELHQNGNLRRKDRQRRQTRRERKKKRVEKVHEVTQRVSKQVVFTGKGNACISSKASRESQVSKAVTPQSSKQQSLSETTPLASEYISSSITLPMQAMRSEVYMMPKGFDVQAQEVVLNMSDGEQKQASLDGSSGVVLNLQDSMMEKSNEPKQGLHNAKSDESTNLYCTPKSQFKSPPASPTSAILSLPPGLKSVVIRTPAHLLAITSKAKSPNGIMVASSVEPTSQAINLQPSSVPLSNSDSYATSLNVAGPSEASHFVESKAVQSKAKSPVETVFEQAHRSASLEDKAIATKSIATVADVLSKVDSKWLKEITSEAEQSNSKSMDSTMTKALIKPDLVSLKDKSDNTDESKDSGCQVVVISSDTKQATPQPRDRPFETEVPSNDGISGRKSSGKLQRVRSCRDLAQISTDEINFLVTEIFTSLPLPSDATGAEPRGEVKREEPSKKVEPQKSSPALKTADIVTVQSSLGNLNKVPETVGAPYENAPLQQASKDRVLHNKSTTDLKVGVPMVATQSDKQQLSLPTGDAEMDQVLRSIPKLQDTVQSNLMATASALRHDDPHIRFFRHQAKFYRNMRQMHSPRAKDDNNGDDLEHKPIENKTQLIACQRELMNREDVYMKQVKSAVANSHSMESGPTVAGGTLLLAIVGTTLVSAVVSYFAAQMF